MMRVFSIMVDLPEHSEGIAETYGSSLAERDAYVAAKILASKKKDPPNAVEVVLSDLESGALSGALLLTFATVGLASLCEHAAIEQMTDKFLSALTDKKEEEDA